MRKLIWATVDLQGGLLAEPPRQYRSVQCIEISLDSDANNCDRSNSLRQVRIFADTESPCACLGQTISCYVVRIGWPSVSSGTRLNTEEFFYQITLSSPPFFLWASQIHGPSSSCDSSPSEQEREGRFTINSGSVRAILPAEPSGDLGSRRR